MPFDFEKFVETDKSFAARVTVRQKTGQVGFNLGSVNRYGIRDYQFAVLYFDRGQRVVGIQLCKEQGPGAIEIKQANSNTYIRAKNFCDKFGIDYSNSHSHELKKADDSDMLFFELDREENNDDEADDKDEHEGVHEDVTVD